MEQQPPSQSRCTPKHLTPGYLLSALLCCTALVSCNQPFDPRAPYQDRLVVYSVLSNDRSSQFVRVFSTYDAPNFDPMSVQTAGQITNATVMITGNGMTYVLHDTSIARPDTSRYREPIHAYVGDGFLPVFGAAYTLSVQVPGEPAVGSSLTLPRQAYLIYTDTGVLREPSEKQKTIVQYSVSSLASASVIRMILNYTVFDGADSVQESREIPIAYEKFYTDKGILTTDYSKPVFPVLQRTEVLVGQTAFDGPNYIRTLFDIQKENAGKSVTFHQAVFLLVQAEMNFFRYYAITNGFQDSLSIRLDRPLYSNVTGGVGLFGGYVVDSASYQYSPLFIYNK